MCIFSVGEVGRVCGSSALASTLVASSVVERGNMLWRSIIPMLCHFIRSLPSLQGSEIFEQQVMNEDIATTYLTQQNAFSRSL